jgi:hypothetical protein
MPRRRASWQSQAKAGITGATVGRVRWSTKFAVAPEGRVRACRVRR